MSLDRQAFASRLCAIFNVPELADAMDRSGVPLSELIRVVKRASPRCDDYSLRVNRELQLAILRNEALFAGLIQP